MNNLYDTQTSYKTKSNYYLGVDVQNRYNQFIKNLMFGSHLGDYNSDASSSEKYMSRIPNKLNTNYSFN